MLIVFLKDGTSREVKHLVFKHGRATNFVQFRSKNLQISTTISGYSSFEENRISEKTKSIIKRAFFIIPFL